MCMSAMSRTPAHPPPIKAATTHQNETIWYPRFPWSRKLPGTDAAPWRRFKKIRHTPDGFQVASAHRPTNSKNWPSSIDFEAAWTRRGRPRLEPHGLRLLKNPRY